jgi:Uroporphyrinogen-III synthase
MRLLITRPREDAETLAASLADHGIEALIDPLLTIDYVEGEPLDLDRIQGLLATSANGVRALVRRTDRRDVPLFAVGDATARTATEAGFTRVSSAVGDVEALAQLVIARLDPGAGALLHPAATHVAGDLAGALSRAGFTYRREVLYQARAATALAEKTLTQLRAGAVRGVVLFSPRTAGAFTRLADAADLAASLRSVVCFALSPAVTAAATRLAWERTVVATQPTQADLVAAIVAAWREEGGGDSDSRSPAGVEP